MARFVRSPDVVARRIAGETVLVPIATRTEDAARRTARFYVLNSTAEVLWDQLEAPADAAELATQLARHFDMDAAELREDVDRFLHDLAQCGAINTLE